MADISDNVNSCFIFNLKKVGKISCLQRKKISLLCNYYPINLQVHSSFYRWNKLRYSGNFFETIVIVRFSLCLSLSTLVLRNKPAIDV